MCKYNRRIVNTQDGRKLFATTYEHSGSGWGLQFCKCFDRTGCAQIGVRYVMANVNVPEQSVPMKLIVWAFSDVKFHEESKSGFKMA